MEKYKRFFENDYNDLYGFDIEKEKAEYKAKIKIVKDKVQATIKVLKQSLKNAEADYKYLKPLSDENSEESMRKFQRYDRKLDNFIKHSLDNLIINFLQLLIDNDEISKIKAGKIRKDYLNKFNLAKLSFELDEDINKIKYLIGIMQEYLNKGLQSKPGFSKYKSIYSPKI